MVGLSCKFEGLECFSLRLVSHHIIAWKKSAKVSNGFLRLFDSFFSHFVLLGHIE